jgi:hypothetical protein
MTNQELLAPGTNLHLIQDTALHRRFVFTWRMGDGQVVEYAVIVTTRKRWKAAKESRSGEWVAKEYGGLVIAASAPRY